MTRVNLVHLGAASNGGAHVAVARSPFRLGRDPENDHCYGTEASMVSSFHAELWLDGARVFVTDVGSTNGTWLDGVRIQGRVELHPGQIVSLGRRGPQFCIEHAKPHRPADGHTFAEAPPIEIPGGDGDTVVPSPVGSPHAKPTADRGNGDVQPFPWERGAGSPRTPAPADANVAANPDHTRGIGMQTLMRHISAVRVEERRRVTHVVVGFVAAMLVLAAGTFFYVRAGGNDWSHLDEYRDRVFAVCVQTIVDGKPSYSHVGTAWSYQPGLLGTNAHVAEACTKLHPDQRLVARTIRSDELVELRIEEALLHANWEPVCAQMSYYSPLKGRKLLGREGRFDVALLRVQDEDVGRQGALLPVADADVTASIRQGQPIHYLGFPSENRDFDPVRPDVSYFSGKVARILDLWFSQAASFVATGFIGVDIPAAGGASGGPLFDAEGRVVALLTKGDFVHGMGGRSAQGVFYGPNVSLLREVWRSEVPPARAEQLEKTIAELWRNGVLEHEVPALTQIADQWLEQLESNGLARASGAEPVENQEFTLRTGERRDFEFSMPGADCAVVVTAIPVEQPLHLVLSIGKLESRDYNNAPYFPFLVAHGKDSKATVTVSALEGTKAEQSKVRLKILKVPLRKK